jgi:hypothetical protein
VEQLGRVLVNGFNVPDEPSLSFALGMAVEIGDALIKNAFRRDPNGDEQVLTEAKEIVRDYLYRKLS